MAQTAVPTHTLHGGTAWPAVGLGTYPLRGEEVVVTSELPGRDHGYEDALVRSPGVAPVLDQVEMHPAFPQAALRAAHERLGVRTEAWSPLGERERLLSRSAVTDAVRDHRVTGGQVVQRRHVQLGAVPLPRSATPDRQRANLDVFGFELTEAEMAALTALGRPDGRVFGGDPETHEEM